MGSAALRRQKAIARRPKGAATRARIVSEARRILIEDGYDALALRRVAAVAGIQLGNLQYYFPNRESLLLEILRAEAKSDLDTLGALVERGLETELLVRELVALFVRRWRGRSGVVHMTLGFLSHHNPVLRKAYREYYAAFYAHLERALERADPGQPLPVYAERARLLNAMMDGAAMQRSVGPLKPYLDAVCSAAEGIVAPAARGGPAA
ncbi:MAG: TetR/AcrR family transcriptional regulator [Myxococcota bacterium]